MCDDDLVARVARVMVVYAKEHGISLWRDECSGLARDALASIEAAGYVVVPREPTVKMQRAGFLALDTSRDCNCDQKDVWQAMIDAALEKDKANVR